MKRREFLAVLGGAAGCWPLAARAQQGSTTRRIGFLANDPTIPTQLAGKAVLEGLQEQGFVEGQNLVIERRFAQGASERSSELAAELVGLDPDLIVASGQNNIAALRQETMSIPVVVVNAFDPIGMGIVRSLALPGGNFTGVTSPVSLRMPGKRLQLLKDVFPQVSRLAVLRTPSFATDQMQWDWLERGGTPSTASLSRVARFRACSAERIP